MRRLATLLRSAQLYAHAAHHAASGCTFLQDHEFLGETYAELEGFYDDVVERGFGTGEISPKMLWQIQDDAVNEMEEVGEDCCNEELLECVQGSLIRICDEIEKLAKGKYSQGTINLLVGIADKLEHRAKYLIARRLKEVDAMDDEAGEK